MKTDPVSITRLYFECANLADFTAIERMLHAEATYSSAHTGLYFGVKDIMRMMRGFFANHQSLVWHIDDCQLTSPHITEVTFTCLAVDQQGQQVVRNGTERLVVVDGLIRHIEVR
ncbi:nuclear transport factor 2 family protein [Marinicella meishanensis]|uniref:nuclear transport factor 2 family protein n=1 Tax=Marinicella meishanensis TaxID=2873263 RepID=UPI001CBF6DA2|nr:nuclear transport factor 2 family protein [Marinicella sp. NBU2979]